MASMDPVAWFLQLRRTPAAGAHAEPAPGPGPGAPIKSRFPRSSLRPSKPDDTPRLKRSVSWNTHIEVWRLPARAVTWSSHVEIFVIPARGDEAPDDCNPPCSSLSETCGISERDEFFESKMIFESKE